ncbi:MAG: hypothetical protein DMF61_01280 [Blastocatellia bacterium AA13]|nr:MAG: hypothetical protein DMF61_01280 [Blastocatellia bacterium AA13]
MQGARGRRFVVVSGIPGSGKTSLARSLAPRLGLPVLDKDDILDGLFEPQGPGDESWRRRLSRESDAIFQQKASASTGAILVSHWHLSGMPLDSGTPTDWISELSVGAINVHCYCQPELAATRFLNRIRHAGHLDKRSTYDEVLRSFRVLVSLGSLDNKSSISVDTSDVINADEVARKIEAAFERCLKRVV